jgi:hypothetical protein
MTPRKRTPAGRFEPSIPDVSPPLPPEPPYADVPEPAVALEHRVLPIYDERRYRADLELLSRTWGTSSVEAEDYSRRWGVATLADEVRYGTRLDPHPDPPPLAGF